MRRINIFMVFLLILMMISFAVASADAMICAGGVITAGDRSSDVLAKCGPPEVKESHQEEVSHKLDANTREKIFITVEEWTYNFGPDKLRRIVTIKNGTVTNIQETR
jgi:hypothetical protein